MAIETKVLPYEILFRWRQEKLAGIHAQDIVCVYDDGKLISEQVTNARPVKVEELEGVYSAAQIAADLSQAHIDHAEEKAAWEKRQEKMQKKIDELSKELRALNA